MHQLANKKILMTRAEDFMTEWVSDALFHGLISLGNIEVTDWPMLWYMYDDGRVDKRSPYKSHTELHGKGFGLYRLIGNDQHIDRDISNLKDKIHKQYFDLIILTLLPRTDIKSDLEDLIFECYPPDKIIIICDNVSPTMTDPWDTWPMIDRGTFFKRELTFNHPQIHPISYAFPKEKIIDRTNIKKEKLLANMHVSPAGTSGSNYTFNNEKDYYTEYAKSYFGVTRRKHGWECVRHYEIIASGCVPWFEDIKKCPELTCTALPKQELITVCDLIDEMGIDWFLTPAGQKTYWELQEKIFNHFLKYGTTEALAKYVLNKHAKIWDKDAR